jgi:hypothetical protein
MPMMELDKWALQHAQRLAAKYDGLRQSEIYLYLVDMKQKDITEEGLPVADAIASHAHDYQRSFAQTVKFFADLAAQIDVEKDT